MAHSGPVSFRPLIIVVLVLLGVTGCTTVTPGTPSADGRPQGVRGPAVSARPVPLPTGSRVPPRQDSALVRIGSDGSQGRPGNDRAGAPVRRTEAPARKSHTSTTLSRRSTHRVLPARPSRHFVQPRARSRPSSPWRAAKAPRIRSGQMRVLCGRAAGIVSSKIVGLCHRAWG
ncbi:hypothetical protein GCM10023100_01820 [Actinocorallia cavernae]|uniref:Lipoprotein n=2 Tax=Actinomycetes TaxID=1760 RepID=A0ABN3M3X8_9ACTN